MAGILGSLFEEENMGGAGEMGRDFSTLGIDQPPRPRPQCNLAGIDNQGATCYLNSLLQTLLLTPEFRDGLFSLAEDELGNLIDADKPGSKVRVIPIQLQRLFARLLLKNCQSVSTTELTTSFGWTDNEQFQQHDVQELNRILFSAIESSLVGTSGRNLIRQLYHGKMVNQIRCTECHKVSEREEDFLDVTVTVAGSSSLTQSLQAAYIDVEMLDGKNQYSCSGCNKLVDAAKGAKLRNLPPILTISLLRFSFDYQKLERYKETGKFTFPHIINMQPYCEHSGDNENLEYELFSVIIHSGGAHGGHYHAFIRDIDSLGNWVTPEDEEIIIQKDPRTGSLDFMECDTPLELIQYILGRAENQTLSIEQLGQEILKQTGRSWNKRFKTRYGPITKFVSKHEEHFLFDAVSKYASLRQFGDDGRYKASIETSRKTATAVTSATVDGGGDSSNRLIPDHSQTERGKNRSLGDGRNTANKGADQQPEVGHTWFDFNDGRVHPIHRKLIEQKFSGRESAYMLLYRKKSLQRLQAAHGNRTYCMSDGLMTEVALENEILDRQREEYDAAVNRLGLQVHFSSCYTYREGALKPRSGVSDWRELHIDQRKTASDLYTAVREFGSEVLPCEYFQINKFRELAAGGHVYDIIPDTTELNLQHLDVHDGNKIFIWNGESVQDQVIPTGMDKEPIFINVIYGDGLQFGQGYAKSLTLQEVMVIVCDIIRIKVKDIKLNRIFGKGDDVTVKPLTTAEETSTLAELGFQDGDQLLAKDKSVNGKELTSDSIASTVFSSKLVVQVENKCVESSGQTFSNPTTKLDVDKNITVGELKAIALSKFGLGDVPDNGRLRMDHETLGLRQPIHEELPVFEAGITQGCCLVLEPGPSPKQNEITLSFTSEVSQAGPDYSEVMVPRTATVEDCLSCILRRAKITDGDWHLRKTNWCGEAAELLDDPDQTLDACQVNDGDVLLLEEGRLPPKGYVRLPIWLYSTPESMKTGFKQEGGIMCWMTGIYNLFYPPENSADLESSCTEDVSARGGPLFLEEVEFSREATLADLKQQVMTLSMVAELPIPIKTDFTSFKIVNLFYPPENSEDPESSRTEEVSARGGPFFLGEVEISREATLADLKQQVMTLSMVAELPIPSEAFMRLRIIDGKTLSLVLRDKHQTLKRLKLSSNSVIALQILPEEEDLSHHQLVLNIRQRIPDTRTYSPGVELVWNASQGASLHSLRTAVAELLFVEAEHQSLAKHFPQRYEWMVLEKQDKLHNQKGKKKSQAKSNLRQAPFHIRDGDTIGVKDMRYDPNNIDNFMTEEDELGRIQVQQEMEEKRKMREERKKMFGAFDTTSSKQKRPELGIKIKVGDFT